MSNSSEHPLSIPIRAAIAAAHRSTGWNQRGQHPKGHAVLTAEFETLDVPAEFRYGLFASPAKYSAVVRLSNGKWDKDNLPDARGFAIKVQLETPRDTVSEQDFVLADSPVFFAKDAADFLRFLALNRQQQLELKRAELDFSDPQMLKPRPDAKAVLAAIRQKQLAETIAAGQFPALKGFVSVPASSLLELTWHSQTPYRLGPHIVKYVLQPSADNHSTTPLDSSANRYRHALEEFFTAGRTARFTLGVIVQTDPAAMPIEDATVPWNGPVVPIATLTIPTQPLDHPATLAAEQPLAFAPHHALPEHAPVGSLNEVRTTAYEDSRKTRHPNAQTIRRYFGCLAAGDYSGMAACLHEDVEFHDLGFDLVGRTAVSLMWQLICLKKEGIRVSVRNVVADDTSGSAEWECQYDFQTAPDEPARPVHNRINATFRFDPVTGLIRKHHDTCDFWTWFEQAMGAKGTAMRWVDKLEDATIAPIGIEEIARRKVRESAIAKLRAVLEPPSPQ